MVSYSPATGVLQYVQCGSTEGVHAPHDWKLPHSRVCQSCRCTLCRLMLPHKGIKGEAAGTLPQFSQLKAENFKKWGLRAGQIHNISKEPQGKKPFFLLQVCISVDPTVGKWQAVSPQGGGNEESQLQIMTEALFC